MGIDNPEDNSLPALWRLVKRLARANPLNNGSVDRGALTIRSPEGLVVGDEQSGADGGGSAKVFGLLNVVGKILATGRIHILGGGRLVASDIGDSNFSMQVYYKDGGGKVVAFGVPMTIQAWSSILQLNEENLRISTVGNASVQLNRDGMRIEAGGNSITMSEESIQIVGPSGGDGVWLELKGRDFFVHNVPDS